jgi:hypothetical protein
MGTFVLVLVSKKAEYLDAVLNEVEKGGVALLGSQREKAHFQVV